MSIEIGQTIGDYEVVSVLGAGGMGRVFKVRNVLSNRFEAMKVLLPAALGSDAAVERFLREIRVQASLDHPNIAALRTALRIDNQIVMVMELVEGATLQTILAKGPLSAGTAVGYMKQALLALAYAHAHAVIHRDIKPGNIMLTSEGNIKLTDFGIAKVGADRTLTATGTTMGSIYYMSPEQVRGGAAVDARSDLYSLGVTLYESVSGALPFQGTTDYDVFAAHLNEVPKPPQERNPSVPAELAQVILKAMAKDPANRFQTAAEFREALEKLGALSTEAPAARATTASTSVTPAAATTPSTPTATRTGSAAKSTTAGLETANVLFMDIVAYSTLKMDQQTARIQELVEIVRNTEEYRIAQQNDQIISLPTGDGMALVFFQNNPAAAVQCATEISRELKTHPEIKLRMGVNSGPVYRIPDINTNRNVAGGGINMAQRVMDCGDAGHILVSKYVADTLDQLSDWAGNFHDLGEAEVKHGVKVHIVNYYTGEVGNAELPAKIKKAQTAQPAAAVAVSAPAASSVPAVPAAPIVVPAPSKKGYVIAAVGVAAAILIALGVTQFLHKNESGDGKSQPAPAAVTPAPPSTTVPPPVPPVTPPSSTAQPQSAQAPVAKKPQEASRAPAAQTATAAPQRQAVPQAAPEAALAPPAAAKSAQPAGPSAEERAQLQEQRERMMLLGGRAAAVAGSVDNLTRQQSRSGLGLRPDMAAARASMDYTMGEAKAALASGDAATAKRSLDLAEQQVEKLEKFLGR